MQLQSACLLAAVAEFVRRHLCIVTTTSKILLALLVGLVVSGPGCSHSLSPSEAAALAAQLANNQCEHQYQMRPFSAEQHHSVLRDGIYRWGGLDVGDSRGFSAFVTFHQDGSEPHVEVYYSSDMLSPQGFPRTFEPPARNYDR